MSIGKTAYYRGRLVENCRVKEVNLTLSFKAISREFKKLLIYRGFGVIEGRVTEVVLYFEEQK
jgi:hypothetical protein